MATITELATLSALSPLSDVLPIVDVSEGSTKKITAYDLVKSRANIDTLTAISTTGLDFNSFVTQVFNQISNIDPNLETGMFRVTWTGRAPVVGNYSRVSVTYMTGLFVMNADLYVYTYDNANVTVKKVTSEAV